MISTSADFIEAIAFELFALERLLPPPSAEGSNAVDFRSGETRIHSHVHENLAAGAIQRVKDDLSPLLFGAAWKIIDLLFELGLSASGARPKDGEWRIIDKQRRALKQEGNFTVFTKSPAIWGTLLAVYAATVEHRYCLVHRKAAVDPGTGKLTGVDRNGKPLLPMTLAEQSAFARAAIIVGQSVASGGLTNRRARDLEYELDQLARHSGRPSFGALQGQISAQVLVSLKMDEQGYVLNIEQEAAKAKAVFQQCRNFDLCIDIPGDGRRQLQAFLEDVPPGPVRIDLNALPAWLTFK